MQFLFFLLVIFLTAASVWHGSNIRYTPLMQTLTSITGADVGYGFLSLIGVYVSSFSFITVRQGGGNVSKAEQYFFFGAMLLTLYALPHFPFLFICFLAVWIFVALKWFYEHPHFKARGLHQQIVNANFRPISQEEFVAKATQLFKERCKDRVPVYLEPWITSTMMLVHQDEVPNFTVPALPPFQWSLAPKAPAEMYQYNQILSIVRDYSTNTETVTSVTANALTEFVGGLPEHAKADFGLFDVPLIPTKEHVYWVWNMLDGMGEKTTRHLQENRERISQRLLPARRFEQGERLTPRDVEEVSDAIDFLTMTPFRALFDMVKFPLNMPNRFQHQLVVGPTGSGKTTFLSLQIAQDLDAVARNEACLFVMDSQNDLIPKIAKLQRFYDGDLKNKLVYLKPSAEHPLALNIFDIDFERMRGMSKDDQLTFMRGTEEMVQFFFRAIVKADSSGYMDAIVKYILRALRHIPNPTIYHFKDLLSKGGFAKYEDRLQPLSDTDKQFLTKDMFGPGYTQSLGAVQARFAALLADEFFTAMFGQARNKIDFFKVLQAPRVVLINTMGAMLKHDALEAFGRFFIARLYHATEERMFLPATSKLPVYVYIDEAQEYVRHETNIRDLIQKARKQNVALTIATHDVEEFDAPVRNALLNQTALQAYPQKKQASLTINKTEGLLVDVDKIDFAEMPHVSQETFEGMVLTMQRVFGADPPEPSPLPPEPTRTPRRTPPPHVDNDGLAKNY